MHPYTYAERFPLAHQSLIPGRKEEKFGAKKLRVEALADDCS